MHYLRNRFGIPGVIAVIALVFAMLGGAYAANNSGNGSKLADASKRNAKKKKAKAKRGPRGPKGAKGDTGPAGPAGPQGLPGAAGKNGTNGTNGSDGASGANGKTVLSGTATPGAAVGAVGDFYIETDVTKIYGPKAATGANGGWGTGTSLVGPEGDEGESVEVTLLDPGSECEAGGAEFSVGETSATLCNGVNGSSGSAQMAGTWAVGEGSVEANVGAPSYITTISFPQSLPASLSPDKVHFIPAADLAGQDPATPPAIPAACDDGVDPPASFEHPEADPGNLCVFTATRISVTGVGPSAGDHVTITSGNLFDAGGASEVGAMLSVLVADGGNYYGSWAVTPPAE